MCLSKTKSTVTLSSTESESLELKACAQEVKFGSMFLGEITKVQKPCVIYEDFQAFIFLEKKRAVGVRTKHIDVHYHFLQEMVEDKDIDIQYIWSEYNTANIITRNTLEADLIRHIKRITEEELWELVDTVRENFNNTRVMDDVITHERTKYSIHALTEVMDEKNRNEWILIAMSRTSN